MGKTPLSAAQKEHLASYIPEFIQRLNGGPQGLGLTKWKQATATKALASPAFENLDVSTIPRKKWFEIIARKYTNYYHQVYLKNPTLPRHLHLLSPKQIHC
ncbi:hypothetical protein B0H13DRAFT_1856022 [Mycena leptocephala]|nr:hypothetical protein B0H13DRAFT_1856022 [Mycena leptocephala]